MRFALRNKEKIRQHFGFIRLSEICAALSKFMIENTDNSLNEALTHPEGAKYPVLTVNSTFGMVEFYLIRKRWDVYTFAFKEIKK